jgi:hypothetical protein
VEGLSDEKDGTVDGTWDGTWDGNSEGKPVVGSNVVALGVGAWVGLFVFFDDFEFFFLLAFPAFPFLSPLSPLSPFLSPLSPFSPLRIRICWPSLTTSDAVEAAVMREKSVAMTTRNNLLYIIVLVFYFIFYNRI